MLFENEILDKLKNIGKQYYCTFFSSFFFGILAHLYSFTNKLFNYDELGQTPAGYGAGVSLGRWGLQLIGDTIGALFRTYSMPMVNGFITLLFIALSSCIIIKTFEIKSYLSSILIGGTIAVFPTLVATYFFMFTAPYYGFAMFLACISAYLIINGYNNKRISVIIMGILLSSLATGIYQSYCSVTICMLLIYIIIELFLNNETPQTTIIKGCVFCISFAVSLIFYLIFSKIAVQITGIPLDTYRGLNNMAEVKIGALFYSICKTFVVYLLLMTPKDIYQINANVITQITFIISNFSILYIIVKRVLSGKFSLNSVLLLLSTILFPVATFFPEILNHAKSDVSGIYTLMTYSVVFIIVLSIVLYEKYCNSKFYIIKSKDILGRVLCTTIFINIFVYIWFANGNYQSLQYTTYHDLAYFETLATQIKSLDGYNPEYTIALVGNGFNDSTFSSGSLMDDYFDIEGKYDTNINYFNNIYLWTSYLGFTPNIIEFKDSGYLLEDTRIQDMPCYPNDGSIAIIDNTIIIKASN